MIQEAIATVDEKERLEKYADIQNYIVDEIAATAYLHDLTERLAYQSSYVSWPLMENAADGIARSLYGYNIIFADLEIYPDRKP
jgi:peptide/nickel transport system substrate-binding protein